MIGERYKLYCYRFTCMNIDHFIRKSSYTSYSLVYGDKLLSCLHLREADCVFVSREVSAIPIMHIPCPAPVSLSLPALFLILFYMFIDCCFMVKIVKSELTNKPTLIRIILAGRCKLLVNRQSSPPHALLPTLLHRFPVLIPNSAVIVYKVFTFSVF